MGALILRWYNGWYTVTCLQSCCSFPRLPQRNFHRFLYGIGSFFVVNAGENEHYLGFLVGEVINKHCIESRTTAFRVQWYLSFESAHTYTAQYWPWMITNITGKLDVPREGRRNADIIHCNFNAVTSNKPISVTVENHLQLLVSHRVL